MNLKIIAQPDGAHGRILDQEHGSSSALWATAFLTLVFIFSRIVFVDLAEDHFANVNQTEYVLVEQGYRVWTGAPYMQRPDMGEHRWAQKPTAYFLAPFLAAGISPTSLLRTIAIGLSALFFFGIVFLVMRASNIAGGVVAALPLIVADPQYIRWDLTLYASYPEAYHLLGAALVLWPSAMNRKNATWRLGVVGLFVGGAVAISAVVAYLAAALGVATIFVERVGQRPRTAFAYGVGALIGWSPFLIWFFTRGAAITDRSDFGETTGSYRLAEMLVAPSFDGMQKVVTHWADFDLWATPAMVVVTLAALFWCAATALFVPPHRKTRILFPAGFAALATIMSLFRFPNHLETRHLLFVYAGAVAAVGVATGDALSARGSRHRVPRIFAILILAIFSFALIQHNARHLAMWAHTQNRGQMTHYRGYDYFRLGMGHVMSEDLARVNAWFDADTPEARDNLFTLGMSVWFPPSNHLDCCLLRADARKSFLPFPEQPLTTDDLARYYAGVGCGAALRGDDPPARGLSSLPADVVANAPDIAGEGYEKCRAFILPRARATP